MAYNTKDLEKKAVTAIKRHNLVFIEEVVSYLPCSKSTFYEHKLDESNAIKSLLEKNRVDIKNKLRSRWLESDNPTLNVALYKLIGTEDEADRLNGSKQKISGPDGGPVSINLVKPKTNKPALSEDDIDDNI